MLCSCHDYIRCDSLTLGVVVVVVVVFFYRVLFPAADNDPLFDVTFLILCRWCGSRGKKTKRGGRTFQRQQKTLRVWHKADLCITECSILRTQLLRETQKATWNASCTFLSLRSQGNWTNFWLAEEFTATLLSHGTAHYFALFTQNWRTKLNFNFCL